ncbi:MAG: VOC family protein [Gemmatimonadaceae bacterium]
MSTSATTATNADQRGRFVWHELMTKDAAAAQEFYKTVVGWTSSSMNVPGVDYSMFMNGETPMAGVMAFPPGAAAMGVPPSWNAYIEVPDVDATIEQVQKLGGAVDVPAQAMAGVGRFAILHDPQGAVFGVLASERPLPPETDPPRFDFAWHELSTSDLNAAIAFYDQVFGWKKQSEMDMGDHGIYYMFGRDRFTYGGMMKSSPGMPAPYWLHYIRVPDTADAAAERATKAGAKLMVGPMEVPGGDRVAVLTDPQGAAFAVHSKD